MRSITGAAACLAALMLAACGGQGIDERSASTSPRPAEQGGAAAAAAGSAAGSAGRAATVAKSDPAAQGKIKQAVQRLRAAAPPSAAALAKATPPTSPSTPADPIVENGRFLTQLAASDTSSTKLRSLLAGKGIAVQASAGRLVTAWLTPEQITTLGRDSRVAEVTKLPKLEANLGVAPNQADVALLADRVRNSYGLTGRGVTIGIISTSFDVNAATESPSRAERSVQAGDLPGPGNPNGFTQPVRVLQEGDRNAIVAASLDEGRAMAELIHDIAPGAALMFASPVGNGPGSMVNAMDRLAAAGADIIVDDIAVGPVLVPYFQDDPSVTRINQLAAQGITYLSSAGNYGLNNFYDGTYHSARFFNENIWDTFDWRADPTAEVSPLYVFQAGDDTTPWGFDMVFQWDEAWRDYSSIEHASRQNMRMYLYYPDGKVEFVDDSRAGGNPVMAVVKRDLDPAEVPAVGVFVVQIRDGAPTPNRVRLYVNPRNSIPDPGLPLSAPSVVGHKNATGAITVGTSTWFNTPVGAELWNRTFAGTDTPRGQIAQVPTRSTAVLSHRGGPSAFLKNDAAFSTNSSPGGLDILFDAEGNRLAAPVIREKPDVVGSDGAETSFFGIANQDFPGRRFFFGTSAAAPNVAAVAALLQEAAGGELTPAQVRELLTSTAQDMDNPYDQGLQLDPSDPAFSQGFDLGSGYGLVQAQDAADRLIAQLGTKDLKLEAVCQTETERRFRLTNPNNFGVNARVSATGAKFKLEGEEDYAYGSRSRVFPPVDAQTITTPRPGGLSGIDVTWKIVGASGSARASVSWFGDLPACQG